MVYATVNMIQKLQNWRCWKSVITCFAQIVSERLTESLLKMKMHIIVSSVRSLDVMSSQLRMKFNRSLQRIPGLNIWNSSKLRSLLKTKIGYSFVKQLIVRQSWIERKLEVKIRKMLLNVKIAKNLIVLSAMNWHMGKVSAIGKLINGLEAVWIIFIDVQNVHQLSKKYPDVLKWTVEFANIDGVGLAVHPSITSFITSLWQYHVEFWMDLFSAHAYLLCSNPS